MICLRARSQPSWVNMSVPMAWLRSVISTMSMPLASTSAQSPIGTGASDRPVITMSGSRALTVQSRSSGSPDSGLILPPMRIDRRAPTPASKAMRTAIGSHIGPTAALPMPRSIMRRRIKVESLAAPPPGLSAPSASTTGPASKASASSSEVSMSG